MYAREVEPRWIQWKTQRLPLPGLGNVFNGYRIVQLSDLHLMNGQKLNPLKLRAICRQVNRLCPDMIVITGDFVTRFDEISRQGIAELAALQAPDGVFGVTGNHDYWTDPDHVIEEAEAAGITMLTNAHERITRGTDSLVIAGVDDIWDGTPNLDEALAGVDVDDPVILLAHESNYADVAAHDSRVRLQLSGHSHGGQVRVPFIGPLALPDIAYRYPQGLYRIRQADHTLLLYTNRGVGMAELPFRFACRPEITLFILQSGS